MQTTNIEPYCQNAYVQTRNSNRKWKVHKSLRLWDTNRLSKSTRRPYLVLATKKNITCQLVNLAVQADPRFKVKESQKLDN